MNETNETTETLAAILAEMREWSTDENDALARYADRIEAAAERKRVEIRRDAEIEWTRIGYDERKEEEKRAPGNAAALREALTSARLLLVSAEIKADGEDRSIFHLGFRETADEVIDALAAPARNCDVGTAEEQAHRFHAFCSDNTSEIEGMCNSTCPCIDCGDKCHCLCVWAQMPFAPAEGGAE